MTKDFPNSELYCKCGCGGLPQKSFMTLIQAIRDDFGKPMPVTSAYRCEAYNATMSRPGGPHTTGRAIDIGVSRKDAYDLMKIALRYGMTGIGFNQKGEGRFIHLDDLPDALGQPRPTIWSY